VTALAGPAGASGVPPAACWPLSEEPPQPARANAATDASDKKILRMVEPRYGTERIVSHERYARAWRQFFRGGTLEHTGKCAGGKVKGENP
jgi:hypothetical protein